MIIGNKLDWNHGRFKRYSTL